MSFLQFIKRFFGLEGEVGRIEQELSSIKGEVRSILKRLGKLESIIIGEGGEHGYFSEIAIGYINKENIFIIKNKLKIQGMSALSMNLGQTAVGTLAFTDAAGKSVPIANETVTTTSSDETIATSAYDPTSGNVTITPVAAGSCTISIDGKNADGTDVPFEDTTLTVGVAVDDATGGTVQWAVN